MRRLDGSVDRLAKGTSTGRVLAGNDATVRDDLDAPVVSLVVEGTNLLELGLEQSRNNYWRRKNREKCG